MLPVDLKELLLVFNANGVEYLVVGGHAVGLHSEPRATVEPYRIDILQQLASGRHIDLHDVDALRGAAEQSPMRESRAISTGRETPRRSRRSSQDIER
jgi:hypothetical protein